MSSWLVARWRILVPVAVAAAVMLAATIALVVPSSNASSESSAEDFDCAQLEEASYDEAGPKARVCGIEIEVTGERTPWETSWALPNGNSRLEVSSTPSRTNSTGEWTDLDTSIEGTPGEGTLTVAAPVYPIELNAGGTAGQGAPLGSIERDGKRIDVWFPTELPVPEVNDMQVTYALADGVRLVVSVNVDGTGFLPVVELANPAAVARFRALVDGARPAGFPGEAGDLVFSTKLSEGLRLVPEEQGSVLVVDEADEVHFLASPPVMWDSAGGNEQLPETVTEISRGNRSVAPLAGDAIRLMDTAVDETQIVITPDEAMLTSPRTVWPVYIDPGFSGHRSAENVAIRTGGYTGTLYNWTTVGGEGAGNCTQTSSCNVVFKQRLVWEYHGLSTITSLTSADVISAGFTVYGTHSYNCTATTTDLHILAGISPATTWGSLEWADYNRIDARTEYHSCGNTGWRTYNATSALKQFADNDSWSTLSLGLKAHDESTMTSWKRFGHDATLSVEYNRAPNAPTSLRLTNPVNSSCVTGSARPFINSATPTMSAIVTDPDGGNVNARFHVVATANPSTLLWNRAAEPWTAVSGTRFSSTVTSNVLANGGTYSWRAIAGDWARLSPYSVWCEFTVDTTPPVAPSVTPVTSGTGVDAVYAENVERGGVGMKGRFTLSPGSSTDVVKFSYSFGDPAAMTTVTVTQGANLVASFDPVSSGPMTLYVKSVDRAGNASPVKEYRFTVASPIEDAIWKLDENTGSSAANSGPEDAGPLSVTGAGWVEGPHQLFGSRDDDWALSFDGVNDVAISGGPVLDTTKSFTVSAHVLLNEAKLGQGDYTVLSQDGLTQSGFRLGYRSNCGDGTDCWYFGMPDTSGSSTATAALSSGDVTAGSWVHLVGEHDATAKTVRLFVCEVGTPDEVATGEPIGSGPVVRGGAAWQSPGAFAVGRGQSAGAGANWWPGQIDNVRLFSGQITDASKLRRLCQGAEAEDFGQGAAAFNAVDPTVSEQ